MPRTATADIRHFGQHYPKLTVIVTASAGGKDNAMTAAWHSSISLKPPLYGVAIAPHRYTYRLLKESGEFGINFIPFEKASLANAIGSTSGEALDKFGRLGIKKEKPLKTGAPVLADAYAAYECRLVDDRTYGDHLWVVGEIVAVHVLEEAFTPAKVLDLARIRPLLYVGANLYASTDRDSLKLVKGES
jgi:flavin reductase (DIM6/NTAB) family NADH-FMN oxidoreductase RutF